MAKTAQEELVLALKADITELRRGLVQATSEIKGFTNTVQKEGVGVNQVFQDLVTGVKGFIASAIGIGSVVAIVRESASAWIEQENAISALNQTLRSTGQYTEKYSEELQAISGELMNLTTHGDEAILNVERQLVAFGAAPDQVKPLTMAVLDLSEAMGKDLNGAALLMGKAIAGEFGTLSRFGIMVDENASKSEKLAQALDQINQRFGGQAAAAAKTFGGQMQQLKNVLGEVFEEIGRVSTEMIGFGSKSKDVTGVLNDIIAAFKQFDGKDQVIKDIRESFADLWAILKDFTKALNDALVAMGYLNRTAKDLTSSNSALATTFDLIRSAIRGMVIVAASVRVVFNDIQLGIAILAGATAQFVDETIQPVLQRIQQMIRTTLSGLIEINTFAATHSFIPSSVTETIGGAMKMMTMLARATERASSGMTRIRTATFSAAVGEANDLRDSINQLGEAWGVFVRPQGPVPEGPGKTASTGGGTGAPSDDDTAAAKAYDDAVKELINRLNALRSAASSVKDAFAQLGAAMRSAIAEARDQIEVGGLRLVGKFFEADKREIEQQAELQVQEAEQIFSDVVSRQQQLGQEFQTLQTALPNLQGQDRTNAESRLAEIRSQLDDANTLRTDAEKLLQTRILAIRQQAGQRLLALTQQQALKEAHERLRIAEVADQQGLAEQRAIVERDNAGAGELSGILGGPSAELSRIQNETRLAQEELEASRRQAARIRAEADREGLNPADRKNLLQQALEIEGSFFAKEIAIQRLTNAEKDQINRDRTTDRLRTLANDSEIEIGYYERVNRIKAQLGLETEAGLTQGQRNELENRLEILNDELAAVETQESRKTEIRNQAREIEDQLKADSDQKSLQAFEDQVGYYRDASDKIVEIFRVQFLQIKNGAVELLNPIAQVAQNLKSVVVNTLNEIMQKMISSVIKEQVFDVLKKSMDSVGEAADKLKDKGKSAAEDISNGFKGFGKTLAGTIGQIGMLIGILSLASTVYSFFRKKDEQKPTLNQTTSGNGPTFEDLAEKTPEKMSDIARQVGATSQHFYISFNNDVDVEAEGLEDLAGKITQALEAAQPKFIRNMKEYLRDDLSLENASLGMA